MEFIYSWRWFGPSDPIKLEEIAQTGASGIVSALHQIPVGDIWSKQDITDRIKEIEKAGLKWEVVESLPVSEDIKRQAGNFKEHIENYKKSIINLADCGIDTICYNFMPILDWSRTNLKLEFDNKSFTSGFQLYIFAAFDLFILKRSGAKADYPQAIIEKAESYFNELDTDGIQKLKDTILYGLPGSMQTYTLEEFNELLLAYADIDRTRLKKHLRFFLEQVIPIAEEHGVKLAIHPDDPPWNLLGLPRIVSSIEDLTDIIKMVESPSNGITLCTGSLGVGHFNDLPAIVSELGPAIHFLHLRNVIRDAGKNFREENLLEGEINMIEVVKEILKEGTQREKQTGKKWHVPIRPDHGHQILDDIERKGYYPGYSLYGRMKNLAELKGLITGLQQVIR